MRTTREKVTAEHFLKKGQTGADKETHTSTLTGASPFASLMKIHQKESMYMQCVLYNSCIKSKSKKFNELINVGLVLAKKGSNSRVPS